MLGDGLIFTYFGLFLLVRDPDATERERDPAIRKCSTIFFCRRIYWGSEHLVVDRADRVSCFSVCYLEVKCFINAKKKR